METMIIITCEHGGNTIPQRYRPLFKEYRDLLDSHRGYDLGALQTARMMARRLDAPLYFATTSRLLVDLNRTIGHPRLFSKVTRQLDPEEKQTIIERHYAPHRDPIQHAVTRAVAAGRKVLHVACHSFAPVLDGRVRPMDIGLLYDPGRQSELRFCRQWKSAMAQDHPELKINSNAPYKGVSDGLATYFRNFFPKGYIGIELELNQRTYIQGKPQWQRLSTIVIDGLERVVRQAG